MIAIAITLLACTSGPVSTGSDGPTTPWDPDAPLADRCFDGLGDPESGVPEYDAFEPEVPQHCSGTDHQDIDAVSTLVFLGDSVTTGTPPTPDYLVYRALLGDELEARFPGLTTVSCAEWGAETDDLQGQLDACLPDPVQAGPVLIVLTIGGNDLMSFAQDVLDGASVEEVDPLVDQAIDTMGGFLRGLREQEATRFPDGVYVVFGNAYEYTDGTGDLSVCPSAELLGFSGQVPGMRDAAIRFNEALVALAVETGTDVVFLLEHFCGHGFLAGDPSNECFRGVDAETWFDDSCIHPNPTGHAEIARMFSDVITH